MMRATCNMETMHYQKISGMLNFLLLPSNKEVEHMCKFLWFVVSNHKIANWGIGFGLNYGLVSLYLRKNLSFDKKSLLIPWS